MYRILRIESEYMGLKVPVNICIFASHLLGFLLAVSCRPYRKYIIQRIPVTP